MNQFMDERRQSLEEVFFAKQNQQLIKKLKLEAAQEKLAETLSEASGIQDSAVIESLIAAGLSADTAAALALVPLIAVAWADHKIDDAERRAILKVAEEKGIRSDHAAHSLLESWLDEEPGEELLASWKGYASELTTALAEDAAASLREDILGRARDVAQSAGGVLGLGSISWTERKVLEQLERALS